MSDLKSRANALQGHELGAQRDLVASIEACEAGCRTALMSLQDLCAQLNVIKPALLDELAKKLRGLARRFD